MNGALARAMRREAKAAEVKAVSVLAPAIKGAFDNEERTRERVDKLERHVDGLWGRAGVLHKMTEDHEGLLRRGFWGRLRWLLRGK